jgi:hypothetical protein
MQYTFTIAVHNVHEHGDINSNMPLIRQVNKGPSVNSYEQFYIQLYSHNNKLVPEQYKGEQTHYTS